jgi:DNA-directed RNA polymerase specialized sigma24 family protein
MDWMKVQELSKCFLPKVLRMYGLENRVEESEVLSECSKRILMHPFNAERSALTTYVFLCLRSAVLDVVKNQRGTISLDELLELQELGKVNHVATTYDDPDQKIFLQEVLDFLSRYRISNRSVRVQQVTYPPTLKSALELMSAGYERKEIAALFKLPYQTLNRRLQKIPVLLKNFC